MNSDPRDSVPPVSQPNSSQSDRSIVAATSVAMLSTVFLLFFVLGILSAWWKNEGDWIRIATRGLKFGLSGSIGVLCVAISAKNWQQLAVPAWLPSTASFAVGFFVMNGLGEVFDGRHENILPRAGSGFVLGACIGLGIHLSRKKRRRPQRMAGTSQQSPSSEAGE